MDNDEFKTTVNKKVYDLKNAKTFLIKISTQKISEEDVERLHCDVIAPDIIELKNMIANCKKKREKIWNVLENLETVCNGGYLTYEGLPSKSESESEYEESIAKEQN